MGELLSDRKSNFLLRGWTRGGAERGRNVCLARCGRGEELPGQYRLVTSSLTGSGSMLGTISVLRYNKDIINCLAMTSTCNQDKCTNWLSQHLHLFAEINIFDKIRINGV